MKREPRGPLQLIHGDIVIATAISHYTHKGAEGEQSQEVGDVLLVNNPHENGHVGGCSLMPGSIGLGNSLAAGTYRKAKPSDKHYVMTVKEWDRYQPERIVRWVLRSLKAYWDLPFYVHLITAIWWAMLLIEEYT